MCNNYINLNFNNCSNLENQMSKKNDKMIDVSTIKKLLSNSIEKNNQINNNLLYNNINNNNNQNDDNTVNVNRRKDKITVNKSSHSKYTLSKSSSMKLMVGYPNNFFKENNSPILIKSNKNNNKKKENNSENSNTINIQQNIQSTRGKTNLNIHNINNINISKSPKLLYKTQYKKHYQTNAAKTMNINNNIHILNRGKSDNNLKIETNDINIFSQFNQKNKNRMGEKTFTKTASCDRIIMNNNNFIKNKNFKKNFNSNSNINFSKNKKMIEKERMKRTIDFNKKLILWINKNYKSNKTKHHYFNFNNNNSNNNNINKNKFNRHDSLLNLKNNINFNNIYDNNIIKNKNFPCVNSINMSNSPFKRLFELNSINSNIKQLKSSRSNFYTINSTFNFNKVQSAKKIHNKNKNSKIQKILNQNPAFSPFSYRENKNNSIKAKKSRLINTNSKNKNKSKKNLLDSGYNKFNLNFINYKPKNLKIESTIKGIESKNDKNMKKVNFEYIKSI